MSKCKADVWSSGLWSRPSKCQRNAATEAGYCRQHDPELKKAKEAARPPTKSERKLKARGMLRDAIAKRLGTAWLNAIEMAFSEWTDVPHPLPDWFVNLCEGKETPK